MFIPWKAWLIASLAFIVIEILPPPTHFFFLCASLGALAASIAAFFLPGSWISWLVFIAGTLGLIPFLIPLAKFIFSRKDDSHIR